MVAYADHDRNLAKACILTLQALNADGSVTQKNIKFQFPPRILSDNRKGSWKAGEMQGTEPVAVFKTSGPREMSLSWTYIVDGGEFTTDVVTTQIRLVRGYFAAVRAKEAGQRNLVVMFQYILYGGASPMSFRIKSIDVKHGDSFICPGGNTANAFPLRTDITLELRLWTKGGANEKIQLLKDLKNNATPEWY